MAIAKQKTAQALIQSMGEVVNLLERADVLAKDYTARFDAKSIDLSDTNLTAAELADILTLASGLNKLVTAPIVGTIKSKDHPSHGTKALD